MLEDLARQELLYQESKKTVRVTDAEVAGALAKLKGQFRNETDFANASPSLRVQVKRRLAISSHRYHLRLEGTGDRQGDQALL